MIVKLTRWLIFTALCSLIPLIFAYFDLLLKDKPADIGIVVHNGELLLITSIICAAAIGEILASGSKNQARLIQILKLITGGSVFIIALFSALLFADILVTRIGNGTLDDLNILHTSGALFVSAIFACSGCIILAEIE